MLPLEKPVFERCAENNPCCIVVRNPQLHCVEKFTYVYIGVYMYIVFNFKPDLFIFIVAPCILKIHCVLDTNKCTKCISYISLKCAHTSLHWKQRTHKHMMCCHITHNNGILIILIRDFSLELYVLPDNMRCAIETCRSSESVLV